MRIQIQLKNTKDLENSLREKLNMRGYALVKGKNIFGTIGYMVIGTDNFVLFGYDNDNDYMAKITDVAGYVESLGWPVAWKCPKCGDVCLTKNKSSNLVCGNCDVYFELVE